MSPLRVIGLAAVLPLLGACGITSRIEPYKQTDAVIAEGEHVVVLARKQHSTHEAEEEFVQCLSDGLADGKKGLAVHSSKDFEDKMYPWFEPSTAPLSTEDLTVLLARPGVLDQVRTTGVRYVIWVDGSTDRVASGGGITCAAGVGGAGSRSQGVHRPGGGAREPRGQCGRCDRPGFPAPPPAGKRGPDPHLITGGLRTL